MTNYYIAFFLLILSVAAVVVRKSYNYLPLKELKRRAESRDPIASKLYPTASYANSLRGLLLSFIIITSAGGMVLLAEVAPAWLAIILVILVLWSAYSWLPISRTTDYGIKLTILVNPAILWTVGFMHRILDRPTWLAEKRLKLNRHTGLYERDDLLELIEQQQAQQDSRFSEEELEIAKRALSFGDYIVGDILIPKKHVKTVLADDVVGPILIDELHKAGQNYVLVRETKRGEPIGTLSYKRLGLHSSGKVRDYLNSTIYYVHEDDSLSHALHTFFITNQSLFVVVNNDQEYLGVITIDGILQQLLGRVPNDDESAEQHANPASVVLRHKKQQQYDESNEDLIEFDDEDPDINQDEEQPTEHTDENTPVKSGKKMIE